MLNVTAPALMEVVSKLAKTAGSMQSKSLIQYTGSTRITPFTLVDRTLLASPELQDTLQILSSLYSGYYIMGVQYSVNSIDGVSVIRQLDKLRPDRATKGRAEFGQALLGAASTLARENYKYRLPMGDDPLKPLVYPSTLGTESLREDLTGKFKNIDKEKGKKFLTDFEKGLNPNNHLTGTEDPLDENGKPLKDKQGKVIKGATVSHGYGSKTLETISQDSNLAVGKVLELTVNIGGQQMTIPVNVRLNTFVSAPDAIVSVISNLDPRQSGREVKALYQAGLIDLWDAITAKSAVNNWRKAAIEDKTGIVLREEQRRSGNKMAAALSGETSFGDISGIYVISSQTASMIEGTIGAKLGNFRAREKLLAKTGVMLLAVMDTQWKRVTIYHHSIDGESSYSFADLKRGGKTNNHDIGMVLEAFRQGQAPTKFF